MRFARNRKQTERFQDSFLEKPEEGHHARLVTLAVLGVIALAAAMTAAGFSGLFQRVVQPGASPEVVLVGTGPAGEEEPAAEQETAAPQTQPAQTEEG